MGLAAELAARLNCSEYKNWLKAGQGLLLLRAALQRFAGEQAHAFHQQLAARLPSPPGSRCPGHCLPRGKQFQPACTLCKEWKNEILKHHTHRNGEVNWGNCRPWLWPSDSWEIAKVIKCRNELMHSSDMKVSSSWLKQFGNHVQNLLAEFQHVPEVQTAATSIEKLLKSDWAVHVPGEDQLDGLEGELSPSQMTEIEAELIKERLREIRLCMEEQGTISKEDFNRIQAVRDFIHSNHDLQRNLQEEMQNLEDLVQKLNSQEQLAKETEEIRCEQKSDEGCLSEKRKRTV
ncbi:uncharacterized protein CXorf38 homolog isoform X1 [Anolis sagrei]|uniref:uncharacterized protein CXorf38 homolog isoform X1 n=1 Tax=Anolis sagrei TaxID=38937 RepID=UPI003520B580